MVQTNEFLNVLNKMGFRTIGGGAVGGVVQYAHPLKKETIVSLRLHPMDQRVLGWEITKGGEVTSKGQEARELLRALQDKEGSGKFRRISSFEPKRGLAFEDLDDYGNNIERAISEIFKLDEQAVKNLVSKMKFEEYLDLAMALDQENISLAEKILQKYGIKSNDQPRDIPTRPTPESVAQHISYLTKNNEDNIVTPEFKQLKISEQRKVLNTLLTSQLQKMLANLRGYCEPGMYESGLFVPILKDEIILKSGIENIFVEAVPNAPNKPNSAASDERLERDTEVSVSNDAGETEEGTVVNDTGNMVTVQTKTGRKTVKKDKLMTKMVDENAIDIKRFKELAGIKAEPIQKQMEEVDEEEEINEDESLGDSFTLEVDGEEIKKNDDSEELMAYAREHFAGKEWTIFDAETGDIAADWEDEGYLQDAEKASKFRMGKEPGWEREEKLKRIGEPEEEPTDDFDPKYEEEYITDEEANQLADRVMMAIGENWPDADPTDVAVQTIKKALGYTKPAHGGYPAAGSMYQSATLFDTHKGEKIFNKVRNTFIDRHGGDFEEYFDQLTDAMQGSDPIQDYSNVPHLGRTR